MGQRTKSMLSCVGVLLTAACQNAPGGSEEAIPVGQGRLHVTLGVGDEEVDGILFSLQPVDCVTGAPTGDVVEETRELAEIWLPGGPAAFDDAPLDADSAHAFADSFFTLEPGCYDVTTEPTFGGLRVSNCRPAHARGVEVSRGRTEEVFLINQCIGRGNGSLDVVSAINRSPTLVDVSFEEDKFVAACQTQQICATATDPDRDPLEFEWRITQADGTELTATSTSETSHADGSITACVDALPPTPGRYDFEVTVFDLVHEGDAMIRMEEWLATAGYPSPSRDTLEAFFYASDALPVVEICENQVDDDCDGEVDEGCGTVDVPEIGVFAGSFDDVDVLRARFDAVDPTNPINVNGLMYEPGSQRVEELDDLNQTMVTPLRLTLSSAPRTRVAWNSALGRELASQFVQTDYTSNWPFPDGRTACVPPDVMIDCCSYTLTEGAEGSSNTTTYYKPMDMFATEADANMALSQIYAQTPIFLPYTDGDVKLGHGWIYNGGDRNAHGSLDYSQPASDGEDPSFRVRAAAGGTVVAKYWDAWHGNVLVIEHPGPGSFSYRTFYFHLRDGKTHDLDMAKTKTVATGDPESSRDKYLAFANLDSPSDLHWGTDADAIKVDVGDTVYAHQHVAWSGNTGPGGAGKGLNTDGTPKNPDTANNHLHFMLAVSHPSWTNGDWLYVDPYGVYEQQSSGCYDLLDNTEYDRLLAPFYPYFHGVDLGVFNYYLYYYGQMGRSPATFTVQQTGTQAIAAGAFKGGLSSAWYVYDYLLPNDFQDRWDTLIADDFRLTERSVTLDTGGNPRHNGVFRPDAIDDWYSFASLGWWSEWQGTFDDLADDGYDVVDFFAYRNGSSNRVAAIFVPQSGGFIHHAGLDSNTFKTVTNDHAANDGYLPVDVSVMELAGGTYLSAIYRQTGDARMVHWGMTAAEYQQWMNYYLSDGWDLQVVQNYASGARYAAIWSK